ncbi:MAG: glycosyltransferase [Patescibacteria group bacterium]
MKTPVQIQQELNKKQIFHDPNGIRWRIAKPLGIFFILLFTTFFGSLGIVAFNKIQEKNSVWAIEQSNNPELISSFDNSRKKTSWVIDDKNFDQTLQYYKANSQFISEVICDCQNDFLNLKKEINKLYSYNPIVKIKVLIPVNTYYNNKEVLKSNFDLLIRYNNKEEKLIDEYESLFVNTNLEYSSQEYNYILYPQLTKSNALEIAKQIDSLDRSIRKTKKTTPLLNVNPTKDGQIIDYSEVVNLLKINLNNSITNDKGILSIKSEDKNVDFINSIALYNLGLKTGYGLVGTNYDYRMLEYGSVSQSERMDFLRSLKLENRVVVEGEGTYANLKKPANPGIYEFDLVNFRIENIKIKKLPELAIVKLSGKEEGKTVLTFDDGPNETSSPKILTTLQKTGTKGVFYVVGSNVSRNPEILKLINSYGHEIANHSYNHLRMYQMSDENIRKQIEDTNKAVEKIIGKKPRFFRTPFSDGGIDYKTENDLRILIIAEQLGMTIANYDSDTKDYAYTGTPEIDYSDFNGNHVLLHDIDSNFVNQGGLEKLISNLKSNGKQIVTNDELYSSIQQYSKVEVEDYQVRNLPFIYIGLKTFINHFLTGLTFLIIFILIIRYLLILIGLIVMRLKKKTNPFANQNRNYGVSIIIPAYNEEKLAAFTIRNILDSDYKNIEVVFVDDGSKDNTYSVINQEFKANPRVKVFTKANGGKGEALNFGIKKASNDYVIMMDADTIFAKDAISKLMSHFEDSEVVGVAGNVVVGNRIIGNYIPNFYVIFQKLEYVYTNMFEKLGLSYFNATYIVPGAIGAYRKKDIIDHGYLQTDTLAEDMHLSVVLLKAGKKINFEKDALCITEAPNSFNQLFKQRVRWQYGGIQVLWKERAILFNPKHGLLGMFLLPYIIVIFLLNILKPVFVTAFLVFLVEDRIFNVGNFFMFNGPLDYLVLGIFVYEVLILSLVMISNSKKNILILPFIPLFYIFGNVFSTIVGLTVLIKILRGSEAKWGVLKRTGALMQSK